VNGHHVFPAEPNPKHKRNYSRHAVSVCRYSDGNSPPLTGNRDSGLIAGYRRLLDVRSAKNIYPQPLAIFGGRFGAGKGREQEGKRRGRRKRRGEGKVEGRREGEGREGEEGEGKEMKGAGVVVLGRLTPLFHRACFLFSYNAIWSSASGAFSHRLRYTGLNKFVCKVQWLIPLLRYHGAGNKKKFCKVM